MGRQKSSKFQTLMGTDKSIIMLKASDGFIIYMPTVIVMYANIKSINMNTKRDGIQNIHT